VSATVVFQAPNRIGLGHIARLSSIALALRERDPSIKVPFILEGSNHELLNILEIPYLSIPSSFSMYETQAWSSWNKGERLAIEREVVLGALTSLRPQLAVFDTLPNGAFCFAAAELKIPLVVCGEQINYYPARYGHV
jgi:UDP-N-acetylglucosamine--N-acetylmuramyl-(pentapeptide) pyrophosphoryl-undecaprenol N-acetylglucosamine transferase